MSKAHWSREMCTLWWRDKGTGRMGVSFHADRAKLAAKYVKLYHEDIDAAIYDADGTRIPLSAPAAEPKKPRKPNPRKRRQEHGAEDIATDVAV